MVVVYGIINYTTISGNDCVTASCLIVIMTCAIVASNSKLLLGSRKGKGSSGANQLELMLLVIAEQLQVLLLIAILVP